MNKIWNNAYSGFAAVYDKMMENAGYDDWAQYIDKLLKPYCVVRVLDCACGTGAFSIRLKRLGYDVVGMDISTDMLRIAQENARGAGLSIPFVCRDMRDIELHRPVDAINCACDGVNYLLEAQDIRRFFRSAHRALKLGGLLLFDISSPYKFENILDCNVFADAQADCAYIWRNQYDRESRLCEMELTCFEKSDMLYKRADERHLQRAHTVEEIAGLLEETGFQSLGVFGAQTLSSPMENEERIQFFAQKKANDCEA